MKERDAGMTEIRQEPIEDGGGVVFQPDTLLPSQFFGALREKGFVEGEKRLMAAVLADAVECYMKYAFTSESRAHQLFLDAEAWIFENETGPWFFSFTNICDVLGLEPEYIHRGLLEWRRKRVPTFRPAEAFRHGPKPAGTMIERKKAVG
ncbi:MAG: hypothetical protein ACREQ9_26385 [Candidatus Binatia bacterium]